MKSTTLYYRQGASDKVYQIWIEQKGDLYLVNFAYGRRGATLQTGTKTSVPVDSRTAANLYEGLIREKKAKGYTAGPDGTPYQHTEQERRVSGHLPQLLNPIGEEEALALIRNPAWAMQEKLDGKRLLIAKEGAAIHGINRKGLLVGLPEPVFQEIRKRDGNFVLDGEIVGEAYHAFDLLACNQHDWRTHPCSQRWSRLGSLIEESSPHLQATPTWLDENEKHEFFQALKKGNKEGVVFKQLDAAYTAGRPASGGSQLKHKFYATASFVVHSVNQKRSVRLGLYDGEWQVEAGNVTIPASFPIPRQGQVVEVRYLYAFQESGAVYQPVYLGARDDLRLEDCTVSQLKYKSNHTEEE